MNGKRPLPGPSRVSAQAYYVSHIDMASAHYRQSCNYLKILSDVWHIQPGSEDHLIHDEIPKDIDDNDKDSTGAYTDEDIDVLF